ncbi:MAG: hypothetical protein GX594_00385 [Pirellulaceae bacterium]|nr:hypothetical protein [Pirellulaceae bacterium]
MPDKGGDVIGQRRALVVKHTIFGSGNYLALDQFGAALQLAENRAGGGFIPATSGDFADNARAVAVFCGVGFRLHANTVPVAGQRCGPALPLGVDPLGNSLALAGGDFRPFGQRPGESFLENASHDSPFALPCQLHSRGANEIGQARKSLLPRRSFEQCPFFGRQADIDLRRASARPRRGRRAVALFQQLSHSPGQGFPYVFNALVGRLAVAEDLGQFQPPTEPMTLFVGQDYLIPLGSIIGPPQGFGVDGPVNRLG